MQASVTMKVRGVTSVLGFLWLETWVGLHDFPAFSIIASRHSTQRMLQQTKLRRAYASKRYHEGSWGNNGFRLPLDKPLWFSFEMRMQDKHFAKNKTKQQGDTQQAHCLRSKLILNQGRAYPSIMHQSAYHASRRTA